MIRRTSNGPGQIFIVALPRGGQPRIGGRREISVYSITQASSAERR